MDNKKKTLSNNDAKINFNKILPSKELQMQRILENMGINGIQGMTPTITSGDLSDAVKGKSVVKDPENGRILGITDAGVIEFDEKIMKALTITSQNILKKFKARVQNGTVISPNVTETLTYIEFTNAAFVETPEFIAVKKELNEILRYMLNSDNPEYIKAARDGIIDFFEASENNIIRGKKQFNSGVAIQNSIEKEFFRALFITEMVEDGALDYEFLKMAGEIDKLDLELIECLYKESNLFTPEQVAEALVIADVFNDRTEVLDYYSEHDKKYFLSMATSEEIAKYIITERISFRDVNKKLRIEDIKKYPPELLEEFLCFKKFPKGTGFIDYTQNGLRTERSLNPKLLEELDRERFLKVVFSEKIAAVYKNPYQSEDYINEYGKLNVDDIMHLQEDGKVNPEDLIKLINFKSVEVQNPEEYQKMITRILEFYNLDSLDSLLKSGKINPKFVELYNKLVTEIASEEQKQVYYEKMKQDLQGKENPEETITTFVVAGLNFGKNLGMEMSEDYIAEQFLEDRIQEKDLLKMYEDGLISLNVIRILYSDTEIIEKYNEGSLDYRVLNILENRAGIIKEEVHSKRVTIPQLMALYSKKDGIQIDEFSEIIDGFEIEDEFLSDFILDEIPQEKIKALFSRYFISHDELDSCVKRNLITQEQADEMAAELASEEQYESMFDLDRSVIKLTEETGGGTGGGGHKIGPGPKRPGQIKNDPVLQELLISQLGFDERTLKLEGTNNSLDGYRIYPSKEHKVMVFLKNDKPSNACYIMSLQQGLFFLNKIVREKKSQNGEIEFSKEMQSDATKQALRTTKFVKTIYAAAGWGENLVSAIEEINPTLKKKLKDDPGYKAAIDEITKEIKKDYKERKGHGE